MTARKAFVDALRGLAVVLMVVNHTARWWLDPAAGPAREALIYGTMVLAGPTFLLLVGFSLALAFDAGVRRGRRFAAIAAANLRRTAAIAAAALALNVVVFPDDVLGARVLLSIALAIAITTGLLPLVRSGAGRVALLAGAAGLYAGFGPALPALDRWSAAHAVAAALLLREFPLFPWLAVVLLGLVLGWREATETDERARARRYATLAVLAVLGVGAYLLADPGTPVAARLAFGRDFELNGYWTAAPLTAAGMLGAILGLLAAAYWLVERCGWPAGALVRLGRTALLLYLLHLVIVRPLVRGSFGVVFPGWAGWGAATAALLAGLLGVAAVWLRVRPTFRRAPRCSAPREPAVGGGPPRGARLDTRESHLVQEETSAKGRTPSLPGGRVREETASSFWASGREGAGRFVFRQRRRGSCRIVRPSSSD